MWLNFSEIEILVLERLCEGSASPGKLAQALGKKNSFISRTIMKLLQKGMLEKNGHELSLSSAAHAQSFKKLFDSRPNAKIENWLCSSTMDVLIVLAGFSEGTDAETIAREVACSKPTLFSVLHNLYSAGVAGRQGKTIRISDRFTHAFAESYANTIHEQLASKAKGHNVSIRIRKNVVVRTDAKEVPLFFSETGMNLLLKHGMDAIKTSYNDYFFNLDMEKREIGTEEAFIHALLLTIMQQHQDKVVLAGFMRKNRGKINAALLRDLAKHYHVEGLNIELELSNMCLALDYVEKVG